MTHHDVPSGSATKVREGTTLGTIARWGNRHARRQGAAASPRWFLRSSPGRLPAVRMGESLRKPIRMMILGFVVAVAIGTALLCLPVCTRGPQGRDLVTALFHSTAALCATCLTLDDPAEIYTTAGQVVLLVEMQLGGIGIMVLSSILGLLVLGRLRLRSTAAGRTSPELLEAGGVRSIVLGVVTISLLVECLTWVALTVCLWRGHQVGLGRATYLGLFHAVSAFTNSGLTVWPGGAGHFPPDPWLLTPVALACAIGGIGYPVLLELRYRRRPRDWSVHTKITLLVSGILMLVGPVLILVGEWSNPGTLAGMSTGDRLFAGTFAGLSPRSAGFTVFDYAQVGDTTLVSTSALMLIGGGSAGTAGGIKVTTLAVLVIAVISDLRGDSDMNVFRRRISTASLRHAVTVLTLYGATIMSGVVFLAAVGDLPFLPAMFEVTSAVTTGGLTTGVITDLPTTGQVMLVVLMFVGRVGTVLAVFMPALRSSNKAYRYPQAGSIIG